MTAPVVHNSYLGVSLEAWKDDMVTHLARERRRNELLQSRLDDANATIARMQTESLDRLLPMPAMVSPLERLRRRSTAVRRILSSRSSSMKDPPAEDI